MLLRLLIEILICLGTVSGQYNYDEVLDKSILFYEAQRSGKLPPTNRIPWRGDSALGDQGWNGEDLTGGWYDSGDFLKLGLPMAYSTTTLAWGILEFRAAYEAAGQYEYALDSIRWPLDYFIKCHVADEEFYYQVGNPTDDHSYWGRPEEMTMERYSSSFNEFSGGCDIMAETAAAFAAGSLVFRESDPSYADTLLDHARRLHTFAYSQDYCYEAANRDVDGFYASCPDMPAECDWDEFNNPGPNYQTLYGALVGGPDQNDNYNDVRSDDVANKVACDFNAAFQGAIAGLRNL